MLHSNVMAAEKPETVQIETLPDGKRRVILSRNFEEKRDEDGASWVGKQAVFTLEFDRTESKEEIEAGFDDWWQYAECCDIGSREPTVEDRLKSVEDAILAMIGL